VRADEISSHCTAFVDVTVIPMDRERQLPHTTVIVSAGRIQSVDPVGQRATPTGCRTIDGKTRYLIPGLSDYVSESNYFNPRWQAAYWGENYRRLRAVKAKYDPDGLFFGHNGVGSEDWSTDGFTRLR